MWKIEYYYVQEDTLKCLVFTKGRVVSLNEWEEVTGSFDPNDFEPVEGHMGIRLQNGEEFTGTFIKVTNGQDFNFQTQDFGFFKQDGELILVTKNIGINLNTMEGEKLDWCITSELSAPNMYLDLLQSTLVTPMSVISILEYVNFNLRERAVRFKVPHLGDIIEYELKTRYPIDKKWFFPHNGELKKIVRAYVGRRLVLVTEDGENIYLGPKRKTKKKRNRVNIWPVNCS